MWHNNKASSRLAKTRRRQISGSQLTSVANPAEGIRYAAMRWPWVALALLGCTPDIPPYTPPPPPPTTPPSPAELLAARPYTVRPPEGYDGGGSWPLLLAFHGYGSNPVRFDAQFGLTALADAKGALLILAVGTPDGTGNLAWHPGTTRAPHWDPSWVDAVLADAKQRWPVDPGRVFVFGYSQGAHMAHRTGCASSAHVAALVSVAGQVSMQPKDCAPGQPVSALQIHGTEDEAIGYFGDVSQPPDPDIPSAHQTIGVWARNDGCSGPVERDPADGGANLDLSQTARGPESFVERWTGCPAGVGVELWTMEGIGHTPNPTKDFTERWWRFLEDHARN